MKIGITNDHAGTELKSQVINYLETQGHEVFDCGVNKEVASDYPVEAQKLCKEILNKNVELGIAICGTGVGMSIACNRNKGIRACCCSDAKTAQLARQHNNSNVLCIGSRILPDLITVIKIIDTFIDADFSNEERHIRRIRELDNENKML